MNARYWVEFWLNNSAAWYLTYLIFSTVVFGLAAVATRGLQLAPRSENALWRFAVLTVPLLTTFRIFVEHLGPDRIVPGPPMFSIHGTGGWTLIGVTATALIGALILTGFLVRAAWTERAALADRRPLESGEIVELVAQLSVRARQRQPRVSQCAGLRSPVAIGRREICLPTGMLERLHTHEAEAVLAHELAHLARRDSLWLKAVHVLERIFFLQPLQRRASRRLRETSEFLADDFAVEMTGGPEPLVRALATFAGSSSGGLTASAFAPGSLLVRRVERVLRPGRSRSVASALLFLMAGAILLLTWRVPAVVPACDCRLQGLPTIGADLPPSSSVLG